MIISMASGKGGTGKTTVAVSLALALSSKYPVQLLDCDVEAPNASLFIEPVHAYSEPVSAFVPVIDAEKCAGCGTCARICSYNALAVLKDRVVIFSEMCHSCGACSYFCPNEAISESLRITGSLTHGDARGIEYVSGKVQVGEALVPPVIRAVKQKIDPGKIAVLDAPPGTACPAVTTVAGSDFCVLATEPNPFGLHDLKLAVELTRKLRVPAGVVINKYTRAAGRQVEALACEGCGLCCEACPAEAIRMKTEVSGHWHISRSAFGPMVYAELGEGQENSGKLVSTVRTAARKLAEEEGRELVIVDGPPGIGCPVISSLAGIDLALVITEPSVSGIHDLERVLELRKH